MYGDRGFHFNRFGDEITTSSTGTWVTRLDDKLEDLKTKASGVTRQQLDNELQSIKADGITRQELDSKLQTLVVGGITRQQLDSDLQAVKDELRTGTQTVLNRVEQTLNNHLKTTDGLVKTISLSKNYIGVGGKRITEVGQPIDKDDAVTKNEIDKLRKTLHQVDIKFKALDIWKQNAADTVSEMYDKMYSKKPPVF